MFRKFNAYVLLLGFCSVKAQLPNTDLWLFKIENTKQGMTFVKPFNITNREGYDNQPSFSADNKKIYFVSVRDDTQADIYYYDLKAGKINQLTKTPISEYSPEQTPDGKYISAVVVEEDSAQRIHFINKETGMHENKFDYDSVGYYHFLNNDTCVYYKLTDPQSLRYNNGKEDKWLGTHPVRTFKTVNRSTLIYGLKDSLKVTFYRYNFLLHKGEKYCEYPSLNEDMVWHPDLGLVKSEGATLLRYDAQKKEWLLLADLSGAGIKKITRFNFDTGNKYLVVVDNL
jgi:dipeptidyl aminopeptidase/acylaminoacyl peptidase